MTDDVVMRQELQRVAAYRELCATVRRGGRHNAVFAALMLLLAVSVIRRPGNEVSGYVFGALALAELLIGLWKWLAPSAEGVLLDAVVLLAFGGWNVARPALPAQFGGNAQGQGFSVALGLFLVWGAVGRFRAYGQLRRLFADRPTRDQLAWFDDLAAEIRRSDPESDPTALDLPTKPHWMGKLLGSTAFLVARKGETAVVAGPWDIDLVRKGKPGRRGDRVVLMLYGQVTQPFEIDAATYDNFQAWAAAARGEPTGPR
jgi:hypothetical protein